MGERRCGLRTVSEPYLPSARRPSRVSEVFHAVMRSRAALVRLAWLALLAAAACGEAGAGDVGPAAVPHPGAAPARVVEGGSPPGAGVEAGLEADAGAAAETGGNARPDAGAGAAVPGGDARPEAGAAAGTGEVAAGNPRTGRPRTASPPLRHFPAPPESLLVREGTPGEGMTLLFHRGRGVARDGGGRAYLIDTENSRILVLGRELRVEGVVGGPAPEDGGLGLPLAAAPTPAGALFVMDVEHPRGLVYFDEERRPVGASRPPVANGALAVGPSGHLWEARSPYLFGLEAIPEGTPLLYRFDPLEGSGIGIAEIEPAADPGWSRLANAGSVAVGPDGTGYFAFLLRNEIRAYGPRGELRWRVTRRVPFATQGPAAAFRSGAEGAGGRVDTEGAVGTGGERGPGGTAGDGPRPAPRALRVRPVTQALAMGPRGALWALTATDVVTGGSTPGGTPRGRRRVELYDPRDGSLLRAATVPGDWTTLAVDGEGRLFRLDPELLTRDAPPPRRRPLPEVELVGFDGDTVRFADYRGQALLINFWASWCEPCREEFPKLIEHYGTLDTAYVEFLAISEDTDVSDARAFAAGYAPPFPLFLGRGRMRTHFRYPGLPYTLVVDYRGRIVREFFGFGSEASWQQLTGALQAEIERAKPRAGSSGNGEEGRRPGEPGPAGTGGGHDHPHPR